MDFSNALRTLHQAALDILFPPTRRTRRVRNLAWNEIATLPRPEVIETDWIHAGYAYCNSTVRTLVQAAKYDGSRKAAAIMGALLYDQLLSLCAHKRIISKQIILAPIPLHKSKRNERGFNHSQRIAEAICKQADSEKSHLVVRSALCKVRKTPDQVSLSKSERRNNLNDCFVVNESVIVDHPVILIDDVTTTGTTFRKARATLQTECDQPIEALAFAH